MIAGCALQPNQVLNLLGGMAPGRSNKGRSPSKPTTVD
jgi:hypothetical protein